MNCHSVNPYEATNFPSIILVAISSNSSLISQFTSKQYNT